LFHSAVGWAKAAEASLSSTTTTRRARHRRSWWARRVRHGNHIEMLPGRLCTPYGSRRQIALAAMFTISASKVTLKMNATTPWARTRRRSERDVTATSDTCEVMPITNEK
jgi:hypothetical protein